MQTDQHLARVIARRQLQHPIHHTPGDERHEGAGHAMTGAIADDYGMSVADRLKPEEIAADNVARFPDQEMVGAHGGEIAHLRQDRGLDTPRITQALQDELICGGGALLALFKLGKVAIDRNAAGVLGAPLAHLEPASVGAVLEHRLSGIAVLREALGDPSLSTHAQIANETALHRAAEDLLIGAPRLGRSVAVIEQFLIFVVAENEAVLGIVKREAFRDRFDRVGEPLLARLQGGLFRRLAGGDFAPRAHHFHRVSAMVTDQMLLVAHPAIGTVFLTEAVFRRVRALVEKPDLLGFDRGEILRMNAGPPEIGIFQIFVGAVTEHTLDVLADKGRREIAGRLEAVDHGRRAFEQERHASLQRILGLLGRLALSDVAP